MKHKSIKGARHLVFEDTEEYYSHFGKQAKPPLEDWKEGDELDWVIADDKGVIQLLSIS